MEGLTNAIFINWVRNDSFWPFLHPFKKIPLFGVHLIKKNHELLIQEYILMYNNIKLRNVCILNSWYFFYVTMIPGCFYKAPGMTIDTSNNDCRMFCASFFSFRTKEWITVENTSEIFLLIFKICLFYLKKI